MLVVTHISLQPPRSKKWRLKHCLPRPPRQIFDKALIEGIYGSNSIVRRNQIFQFNHAVYKNGLLELDLDRHQFYDVDTIPMYEELEAFCHCDIDVGVLVKAYRLEGQAALKQGDRVKIVS